MLKIDKTIENGKAVIAPEGRLDTITSPDMEKAINETIPGISELTLDFAKLEYISSSGLRVLLSAQKSIGGSMKLCNVNETIMEIFDITGFSDILTIE